MSWPVSLAPHTLNQLRLNLAVGWAIVPLLLDCQLQVKYIFNYYCACKHLNLIWYCAQMTLKIVKEVFQGGMYVLFLIVCSVWMWWNSEDILRCSLEFIDQVLAQARTIMLKAIWKTFPPLYNTTLCKNTQTCQHCGFDVCSPVVFMCLCFASGCRLCKSWAEASSQPGGQTRKQMDLFGLNPSHATSSSGPLPTCPSLCRVEGREQSGCLIVYVVWGMGHTLMLALLSRENGHKPERGALPGITLLTDPVCPELS